MIRLALTLLLLTGISCFSVSAQDRSISGTITDAETGEALVGANVLVEGTNIGTITDANGNYSLTVPDESRLVVSYVGYKTSLIDVGNRTVINVSMAVDAAALQEVVVVGYGTQEKVNITGAVSTIDADQVVERPITQTSSALQGLAPGVTVSQNLGVPGNDNSTIRIRGIGSISSDNSPLVLVDGVQVDINDVNPDDIESISVLKDAASAAIYGSRAANGVILITTKRGKAGGFSVDLDLSYGMERPTMLPEYVGLRQQMLLEDAIRTTAGGDPEWSQPFLQDYFSYLDNNPPNDQYQNNDWYDAVVKDSAPLSRQRLSFSGGTDKLRARISAVNLDQDGLIGNTNFNRRSVRANVDMEPTKWVKLSTDLFIQKSRRREPAKNIRDIFHMVNELEPYREMLVGNNLYGWAWRGENPLAYTQSGGNLKEDNDYTLLNLQALFTLTDWLTLDVGYSNLRDNTDINEFTETFEFYGAGVNIGDDPEFLGTNPSVNSLSMQRIDNTQNYYKAILNATKQFGRHDLTVLLGGDALDYSTESLSAYRQNFPLGISYPHLPLGGRDGIDNSSFAQERSLVSAFGRVNYSFMDRYLFEASFRYDGSSRFAPDERWGFFPSFSAGWRISEESFFENVSFVSSLKLRASWGKLGNQNIGSFYPYQSLVDVNQNAIIGEENQPGGAITSWAINNITWEESIQTDIGLDFGFFEDKLIGSFDYYIKRTDQVLLLLASVPSSGLDDNFQNGAEIQNKGIEAMLEWRDNIGEFGYSIRAVVDDYQNEILDLSGTGPYINNDRIRAVGETFDALYGWQAIGFLSKDDLENPNVPKQNSGQLSEGNLKFRDIDGNGVIDVNDRVILGNELPRFNYGINLGASWKGLNLSVLIQGVGQRDGYIRRNSQAYGDYRYDWEADFYLPEDHPIFTVHGYDELGLRPNTDASLPALGGDNGEFNSFWIQSTAYMRIKNITVSYQLPQNLISKAGLSSARIYFSGDNLFTFTDLYDGFDPEFTSGRGFFEYPNVMRLTAGINLSF